MMCTHEDNPLKGSGSDNMPDIRKTPARGF
ncbi:hypothetical protein AGR7A_Cc200161 [Agrobacterium deltaense NCPPB 1641]|uniref:Uncharacterized protein n=1 Tax=Agrobacterium deltaense NCPPB 1641 TaxID=1183425 RepID=A0A1S7TL25_9HYPH|nr:hypothetical protein AGR7A_Cc200161 [Agrobacterium deltaense NCPPB 1641]